MLVANQPAGQGFRLTPFERHQHLIDNYLKYYGGNERKVTEAASSAPVLTDVDVLRDSYRFIRHAEDDAANSREVRLAVRYYERLFKEYAICDLSRYKESKVGMRWRTQAEVVAGKGQFVCGAKGCSATVGLCSYEVNFVYIEGGERRQALVKLRVCAPCAHKLNYKKEQQYRKAGGTADGERRSKRSRDAEPGDARDRGSSKCRQQQPAVSSGCWDPGSFARSELASMPPELARPASAATAAGADDPLAGGAAAAAAAVLPGDDTLWEAPRKVEEASVEENIDEYFLGLFD